VQTLLCCLFGFDEPAVRTLRGLARLFRPSLTAEWEFTDAWQDGCVLLICNIDDATTRELWQQGSLGDMPLALATAAPDLPNGWVLRKPLRGQGMNGLVHVLNQAALQVTGGHDAPPATPAPPTEPEAARATIVPFRPASGALVASPLVQARAPWSEGALAATGPASIVAKAMPQAEPDGAPAPTVVAEPPQPGAAEVGQAAQPGEPAASSADIAAPAAEDEAEFDLAAALERAARPVGAEEPRKALAPPSVPATPPPAAAAPQPGEASAEPAAEESAEAASPAEADQAAGDAEEEEATPPGAFGSAPVVFPAEAQEPPDPGMRVNVVPVSDMPSQYGSRTAAVRVDVPRVDEEAALRDRLRSLHADRAPEELRQDDFLALLNRMHWLRSPGIVTFEGVAPFCIVPTEGLYYGRVTLEELAERLTTDATPTEARLVTSVTDALDTIGGVGVLPGQLRDLFWLANLRCANDEQEGRFGTGAYRLRRWPDLTQLPHERHHVTWCGILARRPVTLSALASLTSAAERELAAFLAACAALSLLEQVEVTAEAENAAPVTQTAKSRERSSIFRSLLNRLGFGRS